METKFFYSRKFPNLFKKIQNVAAIIKIENFAFIVTIVTTRKCLQLLHFTEVQIYG